MHRLTYPGDVVVIPEFWFEAPQLQAALPVTSSITLIGCRRPASGIHAKTDGSGNHQRIIGIESYGRLLAAYAAKFWKWLIQLLLKDGRAAEAATAIRSVTIERIGDEIVKRIRLSRGYRLCGLLNKHIWNWLRLTAPATGRWVPCCLHTALPQHRSSTKRIAAQRCSLNVRTGPIVLNGIYAVAEIS